MSSFSSLNCASVQGMISQNGCKSSVGTFLRSGLFEAGVVIAQPSPQPSAPRQLHIPPEASATILAPPLQVWESDPCVYRDKVLLDQVALCHRRNDTPLG